MSFGLDSEDEMENVTLENSLDASIIDSNEQINPEGSLFSRWKGSNAKESDEDAVEKISEDSGSAKAESAEDQNVIFAESTDTERNGLAAAISKSEFPEKKPHSDADTRPVEATIAQTVPEPVTEEATVNAGEEKTVAPSLSSGGEEETEQPVASIETQDVTMDSTITHKGTEAEEQTGGRSFDQFRGKQKEEDVPSTKQSIGMFSRFLQLQASQSTDSTQNLQEVAKALAQKSPKFETGKDDNSFAVFGAFRKLAVSKSAEGSFPLAEALEKGNRAKTGQTEGSISKEPETDNNTGILGMFRPRLNESLGANEESANKMGSEIDRTKQLDEESDNTTEPHVDSTTGIFGRFRAKVKDSTVPRAESADKVGSDSADAEDQVQLHGVNVGDSNGPNRESNGGIFGLFRARVNESLEVRQESSANASVAVAEGGDGHKDIAARGNLVFDLIHRTREEWNMRGTIQFPAMGPYSEKTVRIGKQVAEGGFSVVFHATDIDDDEKEFALKRIRVVDDETWEACEKESIICNVLKDYPNHILPMLGLRMDDTNQTCYMLLPFMSHSLRAEVDSRLFAEEGATEDDVAPPWDERLVLEMFYHLLSGVEAMHDIGYSHRDLKLDNILLIGAGEKFLKRPLLSDFGSAGPVSRPCASRRDIFEIAEEASQFTTMPYRPPELFPGAVMVGHEALDYCLVDCWSLGCTLFAVLFGASPFECSFSKDTGKLRIVECNQLSVLADLPRPKPDTTRGKWYSNDMWELLEFILEKDRAKRPSLSMIQSRVSSLLTKETLPDEIPAIAEVTSVEDFH